jgi:AcrR family transcriptional regulator
MEVDSDSEKPRRTDARRNRERLIEAARRLFADQGTSVPLASVAKAAGVGTGTAYRHFPTQEELVEAAYRQEIERLRDAAGELLATQPPDEALAAWLHRCIDLLEAERGISEALRAVVASGSDVHAASHAAILAGLDELLGAAQQSGRVRPDVDAADVAAILGGVFLLSDNARAHRLMTVLIDGLRQAPPP